MKYIKKFDSKKVDRTYNVGEVVVWIHKDPVVHSKRYNIAPFTKNINFGDECEIKEIKGKNGELLVKLENLKTNKYVQRYLTESKNRLSTYNEYGHWFNSKYTIIKKDDFEWDILSAIQFNRIDIIKKIKNIDSIINKTLKNSMTPIIFAAYCNNIEIVKYLIDIGSDWMYRDANGNFFVDYLTHDDNTKNLSEIILKYPHEYKQYLIDRTSIEDSEKYNL